MIVLSTFLRMWGRRFVFFWLAGFLIVAFGVAFKFSIYVPFVSLILFDHWQGAALTDSAAYFFAPLSGGVIISAFLTAHAWFSVSPGARTVKLLACTAFVVGMLAFVFFMLIPWQNALAAWMVARFKR